MILGVTGGTGAGKTTALKALETLGFLVIDCDAVYHRLLAESQEMISALDENFPGTVTDGVLDRKKLGRQVFDDPAALHRLSQLTHPFVIDETIRIIERGREEGVQHFAIDAIALFESGASRLCDMTVFITAPRDVRAARIMAREGITEEYALLRIDAQMPDSYFKSLCNLTIMNNYSSAEEFHRYICEEFGGILKEYN